MGKSSSSWHCGPAEFPEGGVGEPGARHLRMNVRPVGARQVGPVFSRFSGKQRMGPLPLSLFDSHRPRRVAELIGIVWMLGLADLFFTLWAHFFTHFSELNPVASFM